MLWSRLLQWFISSPSMNSYKVWCSYIELQLYCILTCTLDVFLCQWLHGALPDGLLVICPLYPLPPLLRPISLLLYFLHSSLHPVWLILSSIFGSVNSFLPRLSAPISYDLLSSALDASGFSYDFFASVSASLSDVFHPGVGDSAVTVSELVDGGAIFPLQEIQ